MEKGGAVDIDVLEYREKQARVYQAPETRPTKGPESKGSPGSHPTEAADVYAFGIILIELATRNDPYGVSHRWCYLVTIIIGGVSKCGNQAGTAGRGNLGVYRRERQ